MKTALWFRQLFSLVLMFLMAFAIACTGDDDDSGGTANDDDIVDDDDDSDVSCHPMYCCQENAGKIGRVASSGTIMENFLGQLLLAKGEQLVKLAESVGLKPGTTGFNVAIAMILNSSSIPKVGKEGNIRQQAASELVRLGETFTLYIDYTLEEGEVAALFIQPTETGVWDPKGAFAVIEDFEVVSWDEGQSASVDLILDASAAADLVGSHRVLLTVGAGEDSSAFDPCRISQPIEVVWEFAPAE